jgi:hypothetical protein
LRVSVSEVIESHLTMYYGGAFLAERLERVENKLNELMARVLPLVERVNVLLQQVEHETMTAPAQPSAQPRVVPYSEIYREDKTP